MWALCNDLFGDCMICLQFQPSLSLLDPLQSSYRATSAFLLQAFTQSCIVVSSMSYSLSWMKGRLACRGRSHCQIANTNIYAGDFGKLFTGWLRHVDFQRNEYIEGFPGFIVPELGVAYCGPMTNERDVLIVALVGDGGTPVECADTDLLVALKGVVALMGIVRCG